jgi:hypothetical protein
MPKPLPDDVLNYFREQGAKGGRIGGPAAAASMTAAQRKARATTASRAAALARTAKKLARGQRKLDAAMAELKTIERQHARTKKKHAKKTHANDAAVQASAKRMMTKHAASLAKLAKG